MSFPPIHRVVTGHSADGKAIVASNGPLPNVVEIAAIPGTVFHEVWSTAATPAPVDNGADTAHTGEDEYEVRDSAHRDHGWDVRAQDALAQDVGVLRSDGDDE